MEPQILVKFVRKKMMIYIAAKYNIWKKILILLIIENEIKLEKYKIRVMITHFQ